MLLIREQTLQALNPRRSLGTPSNDILSAVRMQGSVCTLAQLLPCCATINVYGTSRYATVYDIYRTGTVRTKLLALCCAGCTTGFAKGLS